MEKEIIQNWIERLLKVSRSIDANSEGEDVNRLIGYCESGEALLEKKIEEREKMSEEKDTVDR